MKNAVKKRAPTLRYISQNEMSLASFETPFDRQLNPRNRWVVLAHLIPWDEVCNLYQRHIGMSTTGRPPLSPRLVIGSLIIKHLCNLDDREAVDQMSENLYMQYFLGYSSFTSEAPFDPSLLVEFRKRLGMDNLNAINERIVALKTWFEHKEEVSEQASGNISSSDKNSDVPYGEKKGRIIFDATACPQDIAFPTDLDLLSDSSEKLEEMIDNLYDPSRNEKKPRTYREVARKRYLQTAQKKKKTRKEIRKAIGSQLRFVKRDINQVNRLLDTYNSFPLTKKDQKYLMVINTLYDQQKEMYDSHKHSIEDRIVSIHQPHVRPIVRGKSRAYVEFGSKIHVSVIDGKSFLDELSWDAFNEGNHMMKYVGRFKERFSFYPREVPADQIYCNRTNKCALREKDIILLVKPLGRPFSARLPSFKENCPTVTITREFDFIQLLLNQKQVELKIAV